MGRYIHIINVEEASYSSSHRARRSFPRFYVTSLALTVAFEAAAAIWHEFPVLYEEFVLYEIAEQLNKLHSTFGARVSRRRLGDCERNIASRDGIKSRA